MELHVLTILHYGSAYLVYIKDLCQRVLVIFDLFHHTLLQRFLARMYHSLAQFSFLIFCLLLLRIEAYFNLCRFFAMDVLYASHFFRLSVFFLPLEGHSRDFFQPLIDFSLALKHRFDLVAHYLLLEMRLLLVHLHLF